VVTPADLIQTDLASVPGPLLWLVPRYGVHTPAALLHDRLIGGEATSGISDWAADRYFRFMLRSLGVLFWKRWVMWTAVALRTRWSSDELKGAKRILLVLWGVLSLCGMTGLAIGLITATWWLVVVALLLPLLASLCFDRQYIAGILFAIAAPLALPPAIVALVGLAGYWALEGATLLLEKARRPLTRRKA
jgi:hypothetical protein